MTTQTSATGASKVAAVFAVGLLPYISGVAVSAFTGDLVRLSFAAIVVATLCTFGAYRLRKTYDAETAKQRLIVDPFLYLAEFAFTAAIARYFFFSRH